MDPSIGDTSPPISKLTDDILHVIFSINADMADDSLWSRNDNKSYRALKVTRHTSQVSRYWRTFLLESPTIWAAVIDLELFRSSLENWREEVFRRCGRALLSVKGWVSWNALTDKDALINFFDTCWDRMKHFHVEVAYAALVGDETWLRILSRPATFLRSFKFQLQYYDSNEVHQLFPSSHNPEATPFSNVAPALRQFYQDPTTSISVLLRAPWLARLRVLELNFTSPQRPYATTIQVLDMLENLHLLEALSISARYLSQSSSTDSRPRQIKLPRLHHLGVAGRGLDNCIYFLDHITPQRKCTLSLHSETNPSLGPADEIGYGEKVDSLAKHFSVYAKALDWHNAQALTLSLSNQSVYATIHGKSCNVNSRFLDPPDNFHMKFRVEQILDSKSRDFLPFLRSIPSSILGILKVLDLHGLISSPHPQLHDFLTSLLSVETLITSNYAISRLLESSRNYSACFPSLNTLKLREFDNNRYGVSTNQDTVMDFLQWRTEGGRAIEILDLTLFPDACDQDFGFLEKVTGLRVRWRSRDGPVHEYVCGSGSPEMLDCRVYGFKFYGHGLAV
ncbi:hypothetical protein M413DRAFT_444602 [Hebeloma cylindrosporum]|uniref:F-box domain-containing protein n=1 Tax=Hebeloma cylindrosporum TaxID=76867 RepID=A0A0C3BZX2_HEBCY|nr:hypothetical protein M413DRAFT_444602 [Hebeloma cylindrosporum h7]